jgi:hypothetical protein
MIVYDSLTQSPFFGLYPSSKFHRTLCFGSWLVFVKAKVEPASEIVFFYLDDGQSTNKGDCVSE